MRARARLVIVGGGVMGLATAYQCARRGLTDIVVLDKSYINGGASGRCGGGVRHQWSTESNIRLMRRSVECYRTFPQELGINVWFRQGGYLFLLETEEEVALFEENIRLQNACGVPTRLVSPKEAERLVPHLDASGFLAGSFNPTDGVVFPWPVLWGYENAARRLGVEIHPFTEVTGFETTGDRITHVVTSRGRIAADLVLNAAGAWSPEIAAKVGISLPNQPYRHEIAVTEPLGPFLDPMVVVFSSGLYFSQSLRGEVVGGINDPETKPGIDHTSTLRFLRRFSRAATRIMPILREVKLLRQWAGCYDVTPDHNPILGPVEGIENFLQCNGFVGHGFMIAPAIAEVMADFIVQGKNHEAIERFSLARFSRKDLVTERFIIG